MKHCPVCQRDYTDQSINFCLADGTPLTTSTTAGRETVPPTRSAEAPTETMPANDMPRTLIAPPPQLFRQAYAAPQPAPKSANRQPLLWLIIGLLLSSVIVLAYILIQKGAEDNRISVRSGSDSSGVINTNTRSSSPTATPTPTATQTPSATQTPTATPTPTPDLSRARSEVMSVMSGWEESMRRQDLSSNLSFYADHLDSYYQFGSFSKEQVRADRQRIFAKFYSSTNVQLSNISVEVDSSGKRATVSYDNSYNWRGGAKYLVGKSQNRMVLSKTGSQWLITSEIHVQQLVNDRSN